MKKKLLFVINTMGQAGAETALLALFDALDPQKYEISLYVLLGQGELIERVPGHVKILNRNYKNCPVLSDEGRRNMYGTVFRAMLRRGTVFCLIPYLAGIFAEMAGKRRLQPDKLLWRVLSDGGSRFEEEYDLAVAFLEGGSAYYVADHVRAQKKAAFIHIDYVQAGYTRKQDRDCYLRYDAVFPIAEETMEQFLKVYPECRDRTRIFHNRINQDEIRRKSREGHGFTDGFSGFRILTVGRLTDQKAYPVAIEAMRLLKQEYGEVRWYVLGDGPERPALQKQIREAGLTEDFILLGAVENPYPYYKQTDLYVHATRYEGKSIAIQEAQTLGCAIVASDSRGNREQITQGVDGLLCALDAAAVKEAVSAMIRDEAGRKWFGLAAKERKINYEEDIRLLTSLLEQ